MSSLLLTDMEEWLNKKEKKVHGNYINGEWLESNSDQTFSIYNSAKKSEKLASFQDSNEWDVNQAVERPPKLLKAGHAFPVPKEGALFTGLLNYWRRMPRSLPICYQQNREKR